jgi:hypothetical protein
VANALDALKERADLVLARPHGEGVQELIERLLEDDLASVAPTLTRHHLVLGKADHGEVTLDPYESNILICGTSGSGKSTITNGLLERLCKCGYQYAIIDPEGDYVTDDRAVVLGAPNRAPLVNEIVDVIRHPTDNVVANLLGIALEHRPEFFAQVVPGLTDLRRRTGRPHWLVIDEAHHLLPTGWAHANDLPSRPHGTIFVTVHPERVAPAVLATLNTVIIVGEAPGRTLGDLCRLRELPEPQIPDTSGRLPAGHALYWRIGTPEAFIVQAEPTKTEFKRHSRKYMEGNLGKDRAFFFRGPQGRLNLRAHNLQLFVLMADGVDDETWMFHLRRGHYSTWLREQVKDTELADEVDRVERDYSLTAADSRAAIRAAVDKRYTLPADQASGVVDPDTARA